MVTLTIASSMLYLASKSPRRSELLKQIGLKFEIIECTVDESPENGETAEDMVCRLALDKARVGLEGISSPQANDRVLAADTLIELDGMIIGKPLDQDDCCTILQRLAGRDHRVLSAVALADPTGVIGHRCSINTVCFDQLDVGQIKRYCATGEPMDKAGAYAIQGLAAVFIKQIKGSYSAIMGLPLFETAQLLEQAGYTELEQNDDH